ncbi:MAG: trypsin-like peptidase domain-containing protein, partial [Candidatus Rokubacteria bacterium]|nr:trypsin-like peptidase domain-containing protein [Candidatus Rokubacteria bacterium]
VEAIAGVVYIGSFLGLHALDTASGAERWRFSPGGPVNSSPTVVDGVVYAGMDGSQEAENAFAGFHDFATREHERRALGSGFVLDSQGNLVTNYHVVADRALEPETYRLEHVLPEGRRGPLEVVAVDVVHDLALVPTDKEQTLVGHLGPDLLGSPDEVGGWDPDEAVRRLRTQPDRAIADALLDQRNLAGIGNLYKAEVLFLRGIHPLTPVADVRDLEAMVGLAHRLLMANRGRWTQATTGSVRRGEESYVYGRAGAPCRRCHTLIERDTVGERVTFWCPSCQPARTPQQATTPA